MANTAPNFGGSNGQSSDPSTAFVEVVPTEPEVLDELQRIIDSPDFDASARNRDFLRFSVNEWIAGRADRIKAYAIAVEVFNRDDTFDPQTDPIVRIEASRLRRSLERYYMLGGRDDPLRIDIPKGSYVPEFSRPSSQEVDATAAADAVVDDPTAPATKPSQSRGFVPLSLIALVLAGLIAAGYYLFGYRPSAEPDSVSTAIPAAQADGALALAASRASILVLPYVTVGENAPVTRFSRGLSEVLLQNLQNFDGIDVVDAQVASAAIADPLSAARELDADYVLRGTVMNDADSIRISSQLTSVSTASILWGNSIAIPIEFDSLLSAIDSTAADVASVIAQPYGIVYRDQLASVARQAPDTLNGYLCLVIAYDYRANLSAARNRLAEDCLTATVDREPDNVEAWAMLGLVHLDQVRYAYRRADSPADPMAEAVAAVDVAIDINPNSPLAQHALFEVLYFNGNVEAAFASAERSIELNPNNADFLAIYAMRLTMTGSVDRGTEMMAAARAINPSPPTWYYFTPALRHIAAGDYELALASAERIALPDLFLYNLIVGILYSHVGQIEEAQAAFDEIERLNPNFFDCPRGSLAFRQLHPEMIEVFVEGIRLSGRTVPDEELPQSCPSGGATTIAPAASSPISE